MLAYPTNMTFILEALKRVVDLLLQVAGAVVWTLRTGARKVVRAARQAMRWCGEAARNLTPNCKPLFGQNLLRAPSPALRGAATVARHERLIGWRLNGAPTGESHVVAA